MPDDEWGERVTAVVQVDVWKDLPRSKVGKVLKKEIRAELLKAK